jgi:ATP/maltotriose-dependent transcriptional regulator MalT
MIRGLVAVNRAESVKPFEPIIRNRVMERLADATSHRIAVIVAPAGFGKSVAVRHFLDREQIKHVRYAVRREHATLLGFARGFAEAIEPVAPKAVKSIASVYERAMKTDSPAQELAAWAFAHIKDFDGTIVIDDFHEAKDSNCSRFLADLVDRSKETTRWLIATRETLELPVASWLAYGHMDLPIDEVDLKITADEAAELAKFVGIAMRQTDITELVSLTDGWPVAFAFALRASTRTADFKRVASGTREMVYAYLAEQILHKLRDDERSFLYDTCVFPIVDVALLAENGWQDARAMVNELRRHTAFISVESDDTYRYHELFRQFLQRELQHSGPGELKKRQAIAAAVYEKECRFPEALVLHIRAEQHDRISAILIRAGFDLLEIGRLDLVESALAALPELLRRETPSLLALRASLESAAGRFDRADACNEAALRIVADHALRGEILQRYAQDLVLRREYGKATELLEDYDPQTVANPKVQARMFGMLAALYSRTPERGDSAMLLDRALSLTATIDDEALRGDTLQKANYIAFQNGDYDRAHAYTSAIIELCERNGFDALAARASSVAYAIAQERGDIAKSLWLLQQIGTYGERAGESAMASYAVTGMYQIEAVRGDTERLLELERKLANYDVKAYAAAAESLPPSFALQAAWNGDFPAALQILIGTAEGRETYGARALRWSEIAVYAAAAGNREVVELAIPSGLAELQSLETAGETPTHHALFARCWLALAQLLIGRAASSNRLLQQQEREIFKAPPAVKALTSAVRATYVHLETGEGHAEMARALEQLRRSNLGGYARLFEVLPLPTQAEASSFGSLTKTELIVLKAMAHGDSSRSIGEELERSALTIDTHVKSIVKKLGCKGRREAVALARQHGII